MDTVPANQPGLVPETDPRSVSGEQSDRNIAHLQALEITPQVFDTGTVPLAPEFLNAIPSPPEGSLGELQKAIANYRVLVVRYGAGISWTLVLAVGGSVLLHLMVAGFVGVGAYLAIQRASGGQHDLWDFEHHHGGGAKGGIIVQGADGRMKAMPRPAGEQGREMVAKTPAMVKSPAPEIGGGVVLEPIGATVDSKSLLNTEDPDVIGAKVGLGQVAMATPKALPPNHAVTSATKPAEVSTPKAVTQVALANTTGNNGVVNPKPKGKGGKFQIIEDADDNDNYQLDLMNPGYGSGNGRGKGKGNDVDRGPSGANLAEPGVLYAPQLEIPNALLPKVYGKKIVFEVTVRADGSLGEIKLIESCGTPEIDTICRANLARYKFRPAYEKGQPVTKTMTIGWDG